MSQPVPSSYPPSSSSHSLDSKRKHQKRNRWQTGSGDILALFSPLLPPHFLFWSVPFFPLESMDQEERNRGRQSSCHPTRYRSQHLAHQTLVVDQPSKPQIKFWACNLQNCEHITRVMLQVSHKPLTSAKTTKGEKNQSGAVNSLRNLNTCAKHRLVRCLLSWKNVQNPKVEITFLRTPWICF